MMSWAHEWGTTAGERQLEFPCDGLLERPDAALFRAITVHASPSALFRWLCQLRVAPYSYDWIDNRGRQSPQQLIPGVDQLEIGQDLMTIFTLVGFQRDEHLTIQIKHGTRACRIFGDVAGTYLIVPEAAGSCRLIVKLLIHYPHGPLGCLVPLFLPWGDFVMMRRQLLNLRSLAEQSG